jgi:hypothetical protein
MLFPSIDHITNNCLMSDNYSFLAELLQSQEDHKINFVDVLSFWNSSSIEI